MGTIADMQAALETRYRERTTRSYALYERALHSLPGGDTRNVLFYPPYPTFIDRGSGCRLFDVDGNEYLDFLSNYTSVIHGHAHPRIVAAITEQSAKGTAHGGPVELGIVLAEMLCARVPSVERVRFANSGTEAVLNAIRGARAFTGRSKILKMEGGYHGSYDAAEVSVDPGRDGPAFPTGRPDGLGLSPGLTGEVLVAPFNDLATTAGLIRRHARELAAVIVEPVMGSAGMIPADPVFLSGLREVTRATGVLLIFDEVISFRLAVGGAQALYGVRPDLTTFGKVIGGGLPVGAFGGRADIMALFDPRRAGHVSQSGTFNGNAATVVAGVVALELLDAEAIARINALGERLREELQATLDEAGVPARMTGRGSLMQVHFTDGPVQDYRDAARGKAKGVAHWLHLALLNRGIYPASRGMIIVSTPMSQREIDRMVSCFREAVADILPLIATERVGATV